MKHTDTYRSHLKIMVESQVNIHAICMGCAIGFDPTSALVEAIDLAKRSGKPVVYHWVGPTNGREVEKQVTVQP